MTPSMPNESDRLRDEVREAYSAAASAPDSKHPFPVGRAFAVSVGYAEELLGELPEDASAAFAGVSNVAVTAPVESGATVLDLGCGAGLDALVAARTGKPQRVIGIDFSHEMLLRASRSVRSDSPRITFVQAAAESLPLPAGSIDLVLVNGLFNLNPYRGAIFAELARVVKPGGSVWGAELVLTGALPDGLRGGKANWFS